jgi:O-antigen/teichoic acid export membrane protein
VPGRSFSLSTGAYCGFWLLAAADTFLVRHLLGPTSSGLYVAASTAGSIALFLPNNITLTAFPSLAGAAGDEAAPPGTFGRALAAAAALTVGAAGVLALLPSLVVAILFGPGFKAASTILVLLAISNGAQGMVSFLLHHQLAHHRLSCLMPWLGLAGLAVAANAAHHSPEQVAAEAMVTSLVLFAGMAVVSIRMVLAHAPAQEPEDLVPLPAGFVKD